MPLPSVYEYVCVLGVMGECDQYYAALWAVSRLEKSIYHLKALKVSAVHQLLTVNAISQATGLKFLEDV